MVRVSVCSLTFWTSTTSRRGVEKPRTSPCTMKDSSRCVVTCSTSCAWAASTKRAGSSSVKISISRSLMVFVLQVEVRATVRETAYAGKIGHTLRNADCATGCLLYTSDAADEEDSVDLGGR